MKISNNTVNPSIASGLEQMKSDKVTKSSQNPGGKVDPAEVGNAAKLNVSPQAQQMQKAKDIASKGLNSVDDAKVAHFQNLIDSGKYKVDAEALADKLVDEHISTRS